MSETSTENTMNEDHTKQSLAEKSPILLFLFCTLGSLVATVGAMILILKPKICLPGDETCNFVWLSDEKAGNIGGLFQGSAGVAAAIAGAIVTIILAKIAIDLGRRSNEIAYQQTILTDHSNKIAERQARNEDPDYITARDAKNTIDSINSYNLLILASLRNDEKTLSKTLIKFIENMQEAITKNEMTQLFECAFERRLQDVNNKEEEKYTAYEPVAKFHKALDQINTNVQNGNETNLLEKYLIESPKYFANLNSVVSSFKQTDKGSSNASKENVPYTHFAEYIVELFTESLRSNVSRAASTSVASTSAASKSVASNHVSEDVNKLWDDLKDKLNNFFNPTNDFECNSNRSFSISIPPGQSNLYEEKLNDVVNSINNKPIHPLFPVVQNPSNLTWDNLLKLRQHDCKHVFIVNSNHSNKIKEIKKLNDILSKNKITDIINVGTSHSFSEMIKEIDDLGVYKVNNSDDDIRLKFGLKVKDHYDCDFICELISSLAITKYPLHKRIFIIETKMLDTGIGASQS